LALNKNVKWVVFHGSYDFGYLLRGLRGESLPKNAEDFYKSVRIYFPNIYDLKQVISDDEELKLMGLSALAKRIGVVLWLFSVRGWGQIIRRAVTVC
jgi:CCR4-NOT transcription complex subunit 7/8